MSDINRIIGEAAEKSRDKNLDIWFDVWTPAKEKIKGLKLSFSDFLSALARLTEAMRV